jgi:hypothetical protein
MAIGTASRPFISISSRISRHDGTRSMRDLAVVCIFSVAGLILTALALAFVGAEELAQILAMTG